MEYRDLLEECRLCPRKCGARRLSGARGFCGADHTLRVARAALHFWEEPCLSGTRGSGTVFFSGCPLRCVFCQNREISAENAGKEIPWERLSEIFLELQQKGANNINLVTPTHYVPQILSALRRAKTEGLILPVVYNTSGYERISTLRLLEGMVDVWLPDFKYVSKAAAKRFSGAEDYFEKASAALHEMVRQAGSPRFWEEGDPGEEGTMTRGVIVRHLMLPGLLEDTKAVIRYLYEEYGHRIYLSLMNQYTPIQPVPPELGRRIAPAEYNEAVEYALSLGVENGFLQESGTAEESFIPAFDFEGV